MLVMLHPTASVPFIIGHYHQLLLPVRRAKPAGEEGTESCLFVLLSEESNYYRRVRFSLVCLHLSLWAGISDTEWLGSILVTCWRRLRDLPSVRHYQPFIIFHYRLFPFFFSISTSFIPSFNLCCSLSSPEELTNDTLLKLLFQLKPQSINNGQ